MTWFIDEIKKNDFSIYFQDTSNLDKVTDDRAGYTGFQVTTDSSGTAFITLLLESRDNLREITIRGTFHDPVQVIVQDGVQEKVR